MKSSLFLLLLLSCIDGTASISDTYVTRSITSFVYLNSDINVTCTFKSKVPAQGLELLGEKVAYRVTYYGSTFGLDVDSKKMILVNISGTATGGSMTVLLKSLSCEDIISGPLCLIYNYDYSITSPDEPVPVSPEVNDIATTTGNIANEVSHFICEGTVRKNGNYSVKWYRGSLAVRNQLSNATDKVISDDDCSRRVRSYLTYYVDESDIPNLILLCRIESGQTVEKSANFFITGAGADYKGIHFWLSWSLSLPLHIISSKKSYGHRPVCTLGKINQNVIIISEVK